MVLTRSQAAKQKANQSPQPGPTKVSKQPRKQRGAAAPDADADVPAEQQQQQQQQPANSRQPGTLKMGGRLAKLKLAEACASPASHPLSSLPASPVCMPAGGGFSIPAVQQEEVGVALVQAAAAAQAQQEQQPEREQRPVDSGDATSLDRQQPRLVDASEVASEAELGSVGQPAADLLQPTAVAAEQQQQQEQPPLPKLVSAGRCTPPMQCVVLSSCSTCVVAVVMVLHAVSRQTAMLAGCCQHLLPCVCPLLQRPEKLLKPLPDKPVPCDKLPDGPEPVQVEVEYVARDDLQVRAHRAVPAGLPGLRQIAAASACLMRRLGAALSKRSPRCQGTALAQRCPGTSCCSLSRMHPQPWQRRRQGWPRPTGWRPSRR